MDNNRNLIIAIVLSIGVLLLWEFFIAQPQIQHQQQQQAIVAGKTATDAGLVPATAPGTPPASGAEAPTLTRDQALAGAPRVPIATPSLSGSINLKGGRIDDLRLSKFHEEVDPKSPTIVLLSPSGTPDGYFAEYGWIATAGGPNVPGPDTLWSAPAGARLTDTTPLTLTYDNGAGLVFTRQIAVDTDYMFTVTDSVANATGAPVSLSPYARVVRQGEPKTAGTWILHEGPIGIFDEGEKEITYKSLKDTPELDFKSSHGWLGFTDKYWAATLIPANGTAFEARFSRIETPSLFYQADFHENPMTVAAGGKAETTNRLFAGAKTVALLSHYRDALSIDRFDNLIYWGKLWFITKPMFFLSTGCSISSAISASRSSP